VDWLAVAVFVIVLLLVLVRWGVNAVRMVASAAVVLRRASRQAPSRRGLVGAVLGAGFALAVVGPLVWVLPWARLVAAVEAWLHGMLGLR
jgi:hypothetical protein